jgi:glycosyltransferase involved in cell wall biosynthesis
MKTPECMPIASACNDGWGRLRIGMFVNQPAVVCNGKYYFEFVNLVDFFANLSDHCGHLVLFLPLRHASTPPRGAHELPFAPQRLTVVGIPYYHNETDLARRLWRILPEVVSVAREWIPKLEVVGGILPNVVGSVLLGEGRRRGVPTFCVVRGHRGKTVEYQFRNRPYWAFFALTSYLLEFVARWLVSHGTACFTFGEALRGYIAPAELSHSIAPVLAPHFREDCFPIRTGPPVTVLSVGRLSAEKAPENLLNAFATLSKGGRRWRLVFVGDGPELDGLRRLASCSVSPPSEVVFLGHVPPDERLRSLYREADIFVLASLTEGMPRAVFEAMGMGLPVVASSVGGLPHVLEDGRTGLLVPPGDVGALTAALDRFLSDEGLRHACARAGWELSNEYTFETQAKRVYALIEDLRRKGASARPLRAAATING